VGEKPAAIFHVDARAAMRKDGLGAIGGEPGHGSLAAESLRGSVATRFG